MTLSVVPKLLQREEFPSLKDILSIHTTLLCRIEASGRFES